MTQHVPSGQSINVPEPYADICIVPIISPYGVKLQFGAVQAVAKSAPGQNQAPAQAVTETARINMSLQHWKVLAFAFARDVLKYERESHYEITIPEELLKGLNTSSDEWRKFWYGWVVTGQPYGPTVLKDGKENKVDVSRPGDTEVHTLPAGPIFPYAEKK